MYPKNRNPIRPMTPYDNVTDFGYEGAKLIQKSFNHVNS